jgi:hypothetical protein
MDTMEKAARTMAFGCIMRCILYAKMNVVGRRCYEASVPPWADGCGSCGPEANKACALLTVAEIESAIALKVPAFREGGSPGKPASGSTGGEFCMAATPTTTVMLRLAKKTGTSGREVKGIEMAKQMGAQVDVKTFGPITCSTLMPPSNLASQIGFNTTCSVTKGEAVAAIEVTTKAQKDMVPIDKLRPLAEKMLSRLQ